ncbi:ATP-binding protein [Sphaerisporangium sp. NPDC049002]|uniref:ATP-binding protein n=1 Tax=unclassified Sphaerisporangium TaxID=2630420 RepID=UPI0033F94908
MRQEVRQVELLGAGVRALQVLEREVAGINGLHNEVPLTRHSPVSSGENLGLVPAVRATCSGESRRIGAEDKVGHEGWCREGDPTPPPRTIAGFITFAGNPDQVSVARTFIRKLLSGDPVLDSAMLVVSELVSNSVQHSRSSLPGGSVTVYVLHVGTRVRIEVIDDGGEGVPRLRPLDGVELPDWAGSLDELDLRGRGLRLIDAVAECWDFTIGRHKTITWAELSPTPAPGV